MPRRNTLCYATTELVTRIFLIGVFLYTESCTPFFRVIQDEEWWLYKNPRIEHQTVSTKLLFLFAILVPTITILIFGSTYKYSPRIDMVPAFMAFTLALVLNGNITNAIKLTVGRPRPDFFYRCFPDGHPPDGQPSMGHLECTGDLETIVEGRKSFPSGHSSFSFTGFGFCFFYLAGKLKCFSPSGRGKSWRLCLAILPLMVASLIGISRTCDYMHHWQDVCVGSTLGLFITYVCYRQYYPCLSHHKCYLSYMCNKERHDVQSHKDILPTTAAKHS